MWCEAKLQAQVELESKKEEDGLWLEMQQLGAQICPCSVRGEQTPEWKEWEIWLELGHGQSRAKLRDRALSCRQETTMERL